MTFLDNEMMRRCLDLARLGQGKTHPNPMVGAVVLDSEGRVAGEGYHAYYGGAHAEVMALEQAGDRARGGTLYVSLEPCNHHGKTPPCTSKIVDFDIRRVVCAMLDPNAKVAGQGVQYLKAKRIEVQAGLMEAESREMNRAYCHYIQHKTPYMVLKLAMTLDGKIATRSGQSRWISSASSRRWAHWLRSESDAILSTAETVMKDNSRLTVRDAPLLGKPPIRVVLDRRKRLEPNKLGLFFPDDLGGTVWVVTSPGATDAYSFVSILPIAVLAMRRVVR